MTELEKAARMALEALDEIHAGKRHPQLALAVAHNLRKALTQALATTEPAPQQATPEPVGEAWGWAIEDKHGVAQAIRPARKEFFGCVQSSEPFTAEGVSKMDREWAGLAPHRIVTLYTRPAPGVPTLSKDQIREVFLSHGFTIKEGQTDLKPYVYDAAYALIALVQPVTERKGEPVTIEAVATAGDCAELRWLVEGGVTALPPGVTLLVADKVITEGDGQGEVYTSPQVPEDTARLDWIERQSLDDFAIGFVGEVEEYWCSPESGGMYYGKTLREAIDAARKGCQS